MSSPGAVNRRKSGTSGYRRNGSLRSCEPCRKSKLRCDHVVPACGRCVTRNRKDRCVYHPSPLTRDRHCPPEPSGATDPPRALESPALSYITHSRGSDPEEYVESAVPAESAVRSNEGDGPHKRPRASAQGGSQGFLGETSYSSILQDGLDGLDESFPGLEDSQAKEVPISNDQIARGCKTLSFLEDKSSINYFVDRWYKESEGSCICPKFVLKEWLQRLWDQHGQVLSSKDLEPKAMLCRNIWGTTQNLIVADKHTSPSEWISHGIRDAPRWQLIGLIATAVGLCIVCLRESDGFLTDRNISRRDLLGTALEVSQASIDFSRDCNAIDDLLVWLLYEHTRLTRAVKGETCFDTYRSGGETIDALTTMGLCQNGSSSSSTPFFLAELRKRLLTRIYVAEISTAAFLGRPMRLSHRYMSIDPPLDLRDEQLLLEGPELAAELAGLDANGFSNTGRLYHTTWLRAWLPFAQLREDILDLTLARHERGSLSSLAKVIQERSEDTWRGLPLFMRESMKTSMDNRALPPLEILQRMVLQQDYRSNELLLQRLLIRKTGTSSEKLIHTAQAILEDILLLTQRYDLGAMLEMDVAFVLIFHGMRSAATIAVELLKQERFQPCSDKMLLPRSRTIQDLSVFAARLAAVDTSHEAFRICEQGRKVLTYILDRILSPHSDVTVQPDKEHQLPPRASLVPAYPDIIPTESQNVTGDADSVALHDMEMNQSDQLESLITLENDYGFMGWLEHVDWDHPNEWNHL